MRTMVVQRTTPQKVKVKSNYTRENSVTYDTSVIVTTGPICPRLAFNQESKYGSYSSAVKTEA